MKLTDQQKSIARHTRGPALVFAVAGSGKTTCMVHRIRNLVEKEKIVPSKILATSFNNSAVRDIVLQLQALGVPARGGMLTDKRAAQLSTRGVDCRTLHALGYRIIRKAIQRKYLESTWKTKSDQERMASQLISQTMIQLSIEEGVDSSDLNIDREDLKNQIAIWKGNLIYADLQGENLPDSGGQFARQAQHEHDQYVRAYQIYEKLRRRQKLITFDDMLMTGWEMLLRFPDILRDVQAAYEFVIVDEFQDVNFAQYRILDLITERHRNYMAIGDDDQCIYEWRGASPEFILKFEKVYQAKIYKISDNFRSTAQQIIPANEIVAQNKNRYPKHLSLTRGFGGKTDIHQESNDLDIARSIVAEIEHLTENSTLTPKDLAILIRLYSQTAFLETALIEKQMPYEIEGNEPFYKRSELVTLFQYLSFAEYEKVIRKSGFPEDPQKIDKYLNMFESIINKPRRYVAKEIILAVIHDAKQNRHSVMDTLLLRQSALKNRTQKRVLEFVKLIDRLIQRLRRPAHKTLRWLVQEMEYKDHLLTISGIYELGITKIQTVDALIEFARQNKKKCREFVEYIRTLSLNPPASAKQTHPVKIMTIYRAKGLEWDTVFVPGCNDGLIPCASAEGGSVSQLLVQNVEAERRLFYVAVTRAKNKLHLYHAGDRNISPFLSEINTPKLLEDVEWVASILDKNKPLFRQKEVIEFCRRIADFHLERYLTLWAAPERNKPAFLNKMLLDNLETKITEAEKEYRRYETALKEYRAAWRQFEETRKQWERRVRSSKIIVRKFKSAFFPVREGDILSFELYEDGDVMVLSRQGLVGVVELKRMSGFKKNDVIWEGSEAEVLAPPDSDNMIAARLVRAKLAKNPAGLSPPALSEPKEPREKVMELLQPEFRRGIEVLKGLLAR